MNDEALATVNHCWGEGERAFLSGERKESNPYLGGTRIQKTSWQSGWLSARGGVFYVGGTAK